MTNIITWSVVVLTLITQESGSPYNTGKDLNDGLSTDTLPAHFGFGKHASETRIALWDIDIRPDGKGLPIGEGTVAKGREIYHLKCMACHGISGKEGPYDKLVHDPSVANRKTIGNYWPYSTTLFDYIRRAMPYNQPGSLSTEEVYSLTAFLLFENKIIKEDERLSDKNLASVVMPAQSLFIPDDRTDGPQIR